MDGKDKSQSTLGLHWVEIGLRRPEDSLIARCYSEDPDLLMIGVTAMCGSSLPLCFFFLLKIQSTSQECLSGLAWVKNEWSPGWVPSFYRYCQKVDPDKRNQASIRKRKSILKIQFSNYHSMNFP